MYLFLQSHQEAEIGEGYVIRARGVPRGRHHVRRPPQRLGQLVVRALRYLLPLQLGKLNR